MPFRSALDLGASIRRREISPLEALDGYLARVDRFDPELNAFCLRDDDRARADARARGDELVRQPEADRSPYFGVPIPIKDLHDVAGWHTSFGSNAAPPGVAEKDDHVVARLRAAGMVFMGKTTTPELGTIAFTETERFGITRNPWNPKHTPAGSSGGAGAAVAVGMAPIAHGSDGAGSLRSPASVGNLVGLKPSRNRVAAEVEVMFGSATQGVESRTVADTAAALDILGPFDSGAFNNARPPLSTFLEASRRSPGPLRISVCRSNPIDIPVDAGVLAVLDRTMDLLEELGHEVVEEAPADVWPDPVRFMTAFMAVWGIGGSEVEFDLDRLEPLNRALLSQGTALAAPDYIRHVGTMQRLTRQFAAHWGSDWDLLLTPTVAVEPPLVETCWEGQDDDPTAALTNCLPLGVFTAPFNATGLPAISLPCGFTPAGLPVGMQFAGAPAGEEQLLGFAAELEAALGWADQWPTLAGVS